MVLRDWKKIEDSGSKGERIIVYEWTKGGFRTEANPNRPTVTIWEDFDGWFVDTPKRTDMKFKTKSQALRYAQSYMRSH